MSEEIHEACGVFGILAEGEDVARLAYFASLWLQHRGQESAGIATTDGNEIRLEKQAGRVDRFTKEQIDKLQGVNNNAFAAISHNRYSNTGGNIYDNFQPIVVETKLGPLALAHNGNLVNPDVIAQKLKELGIQPKGSSDSELIALLIALECETCNCFEDAITSAIKQLIGSFSLVILTRNLLIGLRDPWGIRPLCLGRLNGSHYLLSSETCAIEAIGASFIKEVGPGEMVVINGLGEPVCTQELTKICSKLCIFEFIYFAQPGSIMYNRLISKARRHMGERLWEEQPVEVENENEWIVCGVPNSGLPAAKGYAYASGLEERTGFIKNNYSGRTFIEPDQRIRELGVRAKLLPQRREVEGKKVVVVEDSLVRGTTLYELVQQLFEKGGAKEVHVRIASPPYKYRCYMGVDTQKSSDLIAVGRSIEEIRLVLGANSLGFLSNPGMIESIIKEKFVDNLLSDFFCNACHDGNYPFPIPLSEGRIELSSIIQHSTP